MNNFRRYIVSVLLCTAIFWQANAQSEYIQTDTISVDSVETLPVDSVDTLYSIADRIIQYAYKYLGKSYAYGASGPNAFDCSGFTQFVFNKFNIQLPHSSSAQAQEGRKIKNNIKHYKKGDLVFFGGRRNISSYGHVGIFIALDTLKNTFSFIHASHSGVVVSHSDDPYYQKRFICARRVLTDCNEQSDMEEYTLKIELSDLQSDTIAVEKYDEVAYEQSEVEYDKQSDNQPVYHVIRSGDTLYSLARRFGTTVDNICRLNSINTNSTLHIGKVLRIK